MKTCIIMPAYNESRFIRKVILSFVAQNLIPDKLIIIDDGSTDKTFEMAKEVSQNHSWINVLRQDQHSRHEPGKKVINAFYHGLETISLNKFDLIGKFDADILLPKNYFEKIIPVFSENEHVGMASGNLYIEENNEWVYENISKKSKTRGPIKLYRKECFHQIGGLKKSIGWDSVDELLAKFHGWEVVTDESLHVKHLRPTGGTYTKAARFKQGEAFYKMRYGFWLTFIAGSKLAFLKKDFSFLVNCLQGFFKAKKQKLPFMVSKEEGGVIRKFRWTKMKERFL